MKLDIKGRVFIDTTRSHVDVEKDGVIDKDNEGECIKRFIDGINRLGAKKSKIEMIAFGEDELKKFGDILNITYSNIKELANEVNKRFDVSTQNIGEINHK